MTMAPERAAAAPADVPEVRRLRFDVDERPFLVLFETTRACDLACRHCRAEAQSERHRDELSTDEVVAVLDDLAAGGPPRPIVVLTGGDPFKRADLRTLVAHGSSLGLAMAVSPSGTPLATPENLAGLSGAGAGSVSFSIDGASADTHDAFRRVPGSFALTTSACRAAVELGMRLQVNTTITATTVHELPELARLVRDLGASLWSVFFLVTTGRGRDLGGLDADETEDVLHLLAELADSMPLKTTEAPQFRRILHQRATGAPTGPRGPLYHQLHPRLAESVEPGAGSPTGSHTRTGSPTGARVGSRPGPRRPPLAVGDGRGVVFVSHIGEVSPSGFLPLVAGSVREQPLTEIYRTAPLLRSLRDRSQLLGRCGRCEFRDVCGGSRAQAYAATGNPLAEDPTCPYEPAG